MRHGTARQDISQPGFIHRSAGKSFPCIAGAKIKKCWMFNIKLRFLADR
jgi:hypothetical protein